MKIRKIVTSLLVIFIALFCLMSAFLYHASAPIRKERKETIEIAKKYVDLESPDDFYLFNRNKTYYTITGKDKHHEEIFVTVPKDGDKIKVLKQKNGVTEQDVINKVHQQYQPHSIKKVEFGYIDNTPVWEVTVVNKNDTLSYYIYRFDNGKLFDKITNF